jgi:two-component system, chemotaxis family, CheB/CheR fusion protein
MSRQSRKRPASGRTDGGGPRAALVVGLGASAGGLEPLQEFLQHVPAKSGLVFVVVQHLEPHHASMLAELLSRHTAMPVLEAADGMRAEPDHVYVIAPGTLLTATKTILHVAATEAAPISPIDALFRSLAEAHGEHAVGVLFSGAGHDGTVGFRRIKEHGGLTLAQPPETAKHDSMLQSAIGAGLVDHVVPVERMSAKLTAHAEHLAKLAGAHPAAKLDDQLRAHLGNICSLIHQRTGHDFSRYKEGTLSRRIRRRLQVRHLDSVEDYLQLLEKDAAEAEGLLKDLLIGVTQFFRDPDAFQALARQIVPRIVQSKAAGAPIRIWVPGCASGEEAYSIAILLREHLERLEARRVVQIFATDLDAAMLAEARHGRYPADIAEQVSPERLARFFVRGGQTYQAINELREMCIFSEHSLIRDPPFSQLDMISCRNVLIYLSAELQKKIVPLFHYALRPGGFLFLGPSECISGRPELFEPVDKRNRIFRRKETVTRPVVEFPLSSRSPMRMGLGASIPPSSEPSTPTAQEKIGAAFERVLRDDYTYPSAVINERGDVLFIGGPITRYLQLPAGTMTLPNLLESFRGSLRHELRLALHSAKSSRHKVVRNAIPVEVEDSTRHVRLVVRPMPGIEAEIGLFLVVLQEGVPFEATGEVEVVDGQPAVERLEDELRTMRAELKTTVEELESANEELKSSNEELISTNEELQSANEEMQTSREELQSLNEELETVNTELRQKVDELGAANSDMQNLFAATEIATIFLDGSLRVAKFTPAATALFHLIEADVGRPLADLAQRFAGQNLVSDAQEVLRLLAPIERQVRTAEGAWFVLRVVPYRTVENVIAGVVVTFVDVTNLKRAEEEVRRQGQLVHLSHDAILIWRLEGGIESWNRGAEELYGFSREEAIGRVSQQLLHSAFPRPWPEIKAELLAGGCWAGDIQQRNKEGRTIIVSGNFQLVRGDDGVGRVLEANRDITARRRAEEALRQTTERERFLAEVVENATMPFGVGAPDGSLALFNRAFADLTGYSREELAQRHLTWATDLTPPEWREREAEILARASRTGETVRYEKEYLRKDGSRVPLELIVQPVLDSAGRVIHYRSFLADITERKRAEARLAFQAAVLENVSDAVIVVDSEYRITSWNKGAEQTYGWTAEEVLGQSSRELLGSNMGEEAVARLVGTLVATGNATREAVQRRRDGTPVAVEARLVALTAGDGRVTGFVAVNRDITERQRSQEALFEAHARTTAVLESIADAFYSLDSAWRFVAVNPAAERAPLGRPASELLGKVIWDVFPAIPGTRIHQHYLDAVETRSREHYEAQSPLNGRWYEVFMFPREGGLDVYLRDIDDRMQAEAALRASEERLKQAQRIAHIGSWELDLALNRLSWSDEVYRIVGLEPQAFGATYEAFLDAVHPEDRAAVDAAYSGSVREGRDSYEIEHRVLRKTSGEVRIVHERCEHVRDAGGRILRSVGMVQDITERKAAEAALREHAERSAFLIELTDALRRLSDPLAIQETASRLLGEHLKADRVGYFEIEGDDCVIGRHYAPSVPHLSGRFPVAAFGDRLMSMYRAGRMAVMNNVAEEPLTPHERERYLGIEVQAQISMPLFKNGAFVAGLTVQSAAPRVWTPKEEGLVKETGDRTWAAIERKRAEEALEHARSMLAEAQRIAHLGSFEYVAATRLTVWSEEEYRIYGLDPAGPSPAYDVMLGKWIHPEDAALLDETFTKAMQERSIYELEHRIVRPDGSVRWVYDRAHPYFDETGNLMRYVGATLDITERKRAEQALRETDLRFRLALRNAPVSVAAQDRELKYIWAYNQRTARPEEIIGRRDDEIFTAEEAARFTIIKRQVLDEGIELREQMWLDRPSGRVFLDVCWEPIRDEAGRVTGVASATVDLTPIKLAEEAVRRSEQQLRDIIDGSPTSIVFLKDLDGRFITVNKRLEDLLGVSRGALRGKTDFDIFPSERAECYREHDRRIVETGESLLVEEVADLADGKRHTFLASKFPLRDPSGRLFGVGAVSQDITVVKEAEERLRRHVEEVETLMQVAPVAIWVANDAKCHNIIGNQAANAFYDAGEGENVSAGPAPGTPVPHRQFYMNGREVAADELPMQVAAARNIDVVGSEFDVVLSNGTRRTLSGNASPLRDGDGNVRGCIGAFVDISLRKQAEAALRRFELLASHSRDIVLFMRRADGRILEANAAAQGAYGYSREELLSLSVGDLRAPDTRPLTDEQMGNADARGILFEAVHQRKDGRTFPVEVSSSGATIDGTRTLISVVRDITARRRAEEALRQSEEKFRHLADAMPQLVWTADPDGTVDYLNRRHETLSGARKGNDGTWTWSPVIHPDDLQATSAAWDHAVRAGRNYETEQRLLLADGAFRWHLARATPIRDESGRIVKWYGTTTDIHQMKEAQRALQDADRSKNEFLAVLSHELRNPLAPIRYSLYVLERTVPGGEQAKRAQEVIGRQIKQLARLVDDLLDVTRISRNKIQLQKGPLELNDLVRRTVEDHRSLFEGKDIAVEITFAAGRLPINGDAARLAQMIGNLLQNAAKFTPPGGRVVINTAAATARGRATLRVVDTGAGIEPAILRRLFQPFMQAEATLDRSKGGLGLGLALVKGLVEMHGGEVCAHSDGPGKGAEFVVELPLDGTAAAEASPAAARTATRRRRVLIIEDNIDAADSLREVLEIGGHVIEVAYGGPEGLAKAREFEPDVVLCDIGLPGMDGFAVARAFRADDSLKAIVLVALSGYALPEDLQRAHEAGFDRHLSKPPSIEKLEELLENVRSSR